MIKFAGALSDEVFSCIGKARKKQLLIFWLTMTLFALALTIFASIQWDWEKWLFLGFTVLLTGYFVCFALAPVRINSKGSSEYSLTIADGKVTQKFDSIEYGLFPIEKAKKVIDYGKWYIIVFGTIGNGFPCQKDLIVSGTLEQFEELFNGKIIRNGFDMRDYERIHR